LMNCFTNAGTVCLIVFAAATGGTAGRKTL